MTIALILAALLAVVAVVAIALPYLREPAPESDVLDVLDPEEQRRLELVESRHRALSALKELELDHRTGVVSDEDYRAAVGPLRRQAAEAMRALDDEGAAPHTAPEPAREPPTEPGAEPGEGQESAAAGRT